MFIIAGVVLSGHLRLFKEWKIFNICVKRNGLREVSYGRAEKCKKRGPEWDQTPFYMMLISW